MIEFEGNLSVECKKFVLKKMRKLIGTIAAIVSLILMVLLVAFGFYIGNEFLIKFSILFSVFMVPVFPLMLAFAVTTKKDQLIFLPIKIYIDIEDETIGVVSAKFKDEHATSSVKQIIDHDKWYEVLYFFGEAHTVKTVIQKDLITKGTIEEFEKLFEDKIVSA